MGPLNLSGEETLFSKKMGDLFRLCEEKGSARFSTFLDERQRVIARAVASAKGREGEESHLFFGGYEDAERTMLGVFPFYETPDGEAFPITPITCRYRVQDKLTHRDFLGALMGLSIKRETIGDILIGDGCGVIFTFSPIASIIVQELTKIGRVGVTCEVGLPPVLPAAHTLLPVEGTISSLRLDCLVSFLTNRSREQASALIKGGLVQVNAVVVDASSRLLEEGSKLSIRGEGKFLLQTVGGVTKKGRIHVTCMKYG